MRNVYTKYKNCYIRLRKKHKDAFTIVEMLFETIFIIVFMVIFFWFLCACSVAGGVSIV